VPIIEPSLLEKRLYEAFDVFDHARSGEVNVRDLGTIIRALGNIHNIKILIISFCKTLDSNSFILFNRMCHHRSWITRNTSRSWRCRK